MDERGGREAPTVDLTLSALLDEHPGVALCAIGPDGMSMTMPGSIATGDHQVIETRSPVDLVAPEDRVVVISAWERLQSTGVTQTLMAVRLANEPHRMVTLHLLDARQAHGVCLGVFRPTDDEPSANGRFEPFSQETSPVTPRFARVRQNEVGLFLEVDKAITQILGWTGDELVGHLSLDFIHPDEHGIAIDNWLDMLGSRAPVSRVRLRHRHRDGSWVWMEITNHNRLEEPEYGCVVAEMVNVSDEMAAHEALRAREQLLERLAEALPVGVVQVDADGRVVYTNSRLHAVLGAPRAATIDEQMATVVPEDRAALAEAFDAVLLSRIDSDLEARLRAQSDDDKGVRRCQFSLRALTTGAGEVTGAIVCVADVTESARLRDELHMRATFDDVTRCHNRASSMAVLESLMSEPATLSRPAVIFVDLNRFKDVNDKLGHAAGDELLGVVARRLLRAVRADDVVGRIGGDEFLVIRPGVTSAAQAMKTAQRLAETFRHQVRLKAGRLSCHASIGVAWSSDPTIDAEGLVAMADAAMYEAKRSGIDTPVLNEGR